MSYNYTPEMKTRLRRIEGQIRGVLRLMEEEKPLQGHRKPAFGRT